MKPLIFLNYFFIYHFIQILESCPETNCIKFFVYIILLFPVSLRRRVKKCSLWQKNCIFPVTGDSGCHPPEKVFSRDERILPGYRSRSLYCPACTGGPGPFACRRALSLLPRTGAESPAIRETRGQPHKSACVAQSFKLCYNVFRFSPPDPAEKLSAGIYPGRYSHDLRKEAGL